MSPDGARRMSATEAKSRRSRFDFWSFFFTGLTGLATAIILAILAVILGNVCLHGWPAISVRFVTRGTGPDLFDVEKTGLLPMIVGTTARVIIMTIFVIPVGVVTAIYLSDTRGPPRRSHVSFAGRSTTWLGCPR